ncbi:hypothetical protein EIK87_21925 [Salmonella enterica subsp. enterica serovar Richmond]|nr:hypothetical protein [Salmonella enterica subsp. enterica serovar Richmond]
MKVTNVRPFLVSAFFISTFLLGVFLAKSELPVIKKPILLVFTSYKSKCRRDKTLSDFGLNTDNLSAIPAIRLKNLARYARMASVFNIGVSLDIEN